MSSNTTIPSALDIINGLPSHAVTIHQACKKCNMAIRPNCMRHCSGCETVTYCSLRCQDRCATSDAIAQAVPESDHFLQSASCKFIYHYLFHFILPTAERFQSTIAENFARHNQSVLTITNEAYYKEWHRLSKEHSLRINLIKSVMERSFFLSLFF
ncbi:hypothetical protein MPER_05223 [Moniliophthora perniciosa FA553]|nr:hypothetical protein MPER_05223 [Moniliophthora perniciosa FA553]